MPKCSKSPAKQRRSNSYSCGTKGCRKRRVSWTGGYCKLIRLLTRLQACHELKYSSTHSTMKGRTDELLRRKKNTMRMGKWVKRGSCRLYTRTLEYYKPCHRLSDALFIRTWKNQLQNWPSHWTLSLSSAKAKIHLNIFQQLNATLWPKKQQSNTIWRRKPFLYIIYKLLRKKNEPNR